MDACVIGLRRPTGELSLPPVASNSPTEIKKLQINLTRAAGMWYYIYVVYGRSFNRTSLELKHGKFLVYLREGDDLLIAPVWN